MPEATPKGSSWTRRTWASFLDSKQATQLQRPLHAARDAALWMLRQNFVDRDDALKKLAASGAELGREEHEGAGAMVVAVREDLGNPVRDVLALEHFDRAWALAKDGRWSEALTRADLSFVLSRGLIVERVALLALALERVGRKTASEGQIEMAAGSRGPAFGQAVRDKVAEYAAACSGAPRPVGVARAGSRNFRAEIFRESIEHLRSFPKAAA